MSVSSPSLWIASVINGVLVGMGTVSIIRTSCLKGLETFKENYVLYERSLYAIFLKANECLESEFF